MSKKKIGLVPKLIIGIIAGILIGSFAPEFLVKVLVTASSLFSAFLKFVIPFIIIGFVTAGIADLATGAGKLLGVTTGIAYGSTIVAGTLAFIVASLIFPSFIDPSVASQIGDPEAGMLEPIFTIPLSPMVDVTAAIVFSFTMGLGISALRNNDKGEILYNLFQEFQEIITKVLSIIIIPLLPIYIAGTFANITYAGQVWNILSIFWRVYLVVIPLHIVYGFSTVFPFILMLGIAMVAAPGAPGGAIMSALPFLPMIGIPSDGGLASLMIALYLTQDSFGTAANVSGDNAIAAVVDHLNKKWSKKADNKVD